MKDGRGTGAASQRGHRKGSRWLLYLTVSAVALFLIPLSLVGADVSSADSELPGFHPGLYDENGDPLTVPLFTDPRIPFDTETREDGRYYQVIPEQPFDSEPAFFAINAENNDDRGRFKVTVSMEGLDGTWMDYCGVRVLAGEGPDAFYADLNKANQYRAHFFADEEVIATFINDTQYRISLETLSGTPSLSAPGPIENITVCFETELIPDYHTVQFRAFGRLVDERILYEDDKIGELPVLKVTGSTFDGWFDTEGNQITADTHVYDLPPSFEKVDIIDARFSDVHWPQIVEWDDDPIHNPDGTTTYGYHKLTLYENTAWEYEITTFTLDENEKEVQQTYDYFSYHPDEGETETKTKTEIETHEDKSETWTTHEETKQADGRTVVVDSVTQRDAENKMVSEDKNVKITDPGEETREYEVEAKLVDEKEMRYRVEATLPDTTILDVDNASELIEEYDYTIAVIGTHSDTGLMIVPEDTIPVVKEKGYHISVSNGEQYVALDSDVVGQLEELGGEVRLQVQRATDDKLTPEQKEVIGKGYAVSVTLTVNGTEVTDLRGTAEVIVEPGFKAVTVYSVSADGKMTPCTCTYDPVSGKVQFFIDCLSVFLIEEAKETDDYTFALPYVYFILGETLLLVLIEILIIRRLRRRGSA